MTAKLSNALYIALKHYNYLLHCLEFDPHSALWRSLRVTEKKTNTHLCLVSANTAVPSCPHHPSLSELSWSNKPSRSVQWLVYVKLCYTSTYLELKDCCGESCCLNSMAGVS
ncbi:hypothetical protein XENOCAPTIV_012477 [Xenoophorus captivus]|uniref:Uncharacterized protein n=1 Tax=Xenoophorus captivus TaxID=1517983 RepID=A0ABV0R3L4_9TELE